MQLATGAKSFADNPVIGSRRLNHAGLHVLRLKLAHRMAAIRRRRLAHEIDPADRAAFDRDGFVLKHDFLDPQTFAALRDGVLSYCGPARETVQGDTITRRLALDPQALAAIPAARALLQDPCWHGLVRYVSSSKMEPLHYIQSIFASLFDAPPDPQQELHADTFHPTMKAWLFLTDVREDEGPLTYVPGSHRLTPERISWEQKTSLSAARAERLTSRGSFRIDREELASLNLPEPRIFAVPANTLVVADTFGFHARGRSAHPSTRVEIWSYGRRNPFLPWTGLDPLSLPGIAERRVPARWRFYDRFERWLGQPWRNVGNKTAGKV